MEKQTDTELKGHKKQRKLMLPQGQEAKENYIINLAYNLAAEKLANGTASSQIITSLINLGTQKAKLEQEKIKSDLRVAEAKIAALESQKSSTELMEQALAAFKQYSGNANNDDGDVDDE